MKSNEPRKRLPVNPSLEHLQKQAKRIAKLNPELRLAAAQHQVAQSYGCKNWAELARVVEVMRRGAGRLTQVEKEIEPLPKAARGGMIEEIRSILRGGQFTQLDLDQGLAHALWYDGCSWAVRKAIADLLLDHGADPDGQYGSNYGPIVLGTLETQQPDGLQYLIDAGADVTFAPIQTKYGLQCPMSQLLGTYIRGNREQKHQCIDILFKHGAYVPSEVAPPVLAIHRGNAVSLGEQLRRDRDLAKRRFRELPYGNLRLRGATLLHCAVEFGEVECVEELFRSGADINTGAEVIDGIGGQTAVFHAINTFGDQNFGMLEYLVKRVGRWIDMSVRATWRLFDEVQPKPMTPLEYAEYAINLETRKWRSKIDEELGILRELDKTMHLKQAILRLDTVSVGRMLDEHPNLLTPELWPPAMFQAASPAMTRLLLARGLNPNESSAPRKPLHFAVEKGWPDIVEELLRHGADPNVRDGEGFTPLDLFGGLTTIEPAVGQRIIGILRKAGAEVSIWTAIRIADTERALELLAERPELMRERSPDLGFSPLEVAARMANEVVVRWLLDHGADVNEANPAENTPLWFACQSGVEAAGRLKVAAMLISAGADVHRRCEEGSTALHYAAWRGPVAVVELLLAHGARNWIVDDHGKLPIDYAKEGGPSPDKEEIVKLLGEPRMENPVFGEAVEAMTAGKVDALRRILQEHPGLAQARAEENGEFAGPYFSRPYLLEFIPENPVRTGELPPNVCQVAQVLIEAGSPMEAINRTLELAASGEVPRACGLQAELLELLVRHGADATRGLHAAVGEGQWDAAETLLRLGAKLGLKAAAGLGRIERLKEMLADSPESEELARAANAAIRGGHGACVELLLEGGLRVDTRVPEHPYAPTLLHQAAWFGHRGLAELLIEHGADLMATDAQYNGTPADWAHHGGHEELSEWLRARARDEKEDGRRS